MIILLSPAKSLNEDALELQLPVSTPRFPVETNQLIAKLSSLSLKALQDLMKISPALAKLNKERYVDFDREDPTARAKASIYTFSGGVYQGLDIGSMNEAEVEFVNQHTRILSGLYGLLRPLDLIQPYRLEMGTSLSLRRKKHLYDFWGDKITELLAADLQGSQSKIIVNCASNEYMKAIRPKLLDAKIIDLGFKEMHKGELKFISFNAKKARGMVVRYAAQNRVQTVEDLKGFNLDGYAFHESLSTDTKWMFTR